MLNSFSNQKKFWFTWAIGEAVLAASICLFLTAFVRAENTDLLDPALVAKGQKLFKTSCVICHGANGDGKGTASASLNPKPRNFKKDAFKFGESYEQILKTIGDGIPNSAMPSWKESLGPADLQAVAAYIKSIRNSLAAAPAQSPTKKVSAEKSSAKKKS